MKLFWRKPLQSFKEQALDLLRDIKSAISAQGKNIMTALENLQAQMTRIQTDVSADLVNTAQIQLDTARILKDIATVTTGHDDPAIAALADLASAQADKLEQNAASNKQAAADLEKGATTLESGSVAGAPNLASLSPNNGFPGASSHATGTGFGISQGLSSVTVGGVSASTSGWSDTGFDFIIPVGVTGTVDVIVTVAGKASNAVQFTITAA